MAGIQDADTVDLVGQDAHGEYIVVMIEERPWDTEPEQVAQLKAKINAYASYILDGAIFRHYPEIANRPLRIQLNCVDAPPSHIVAITEVAAAKLAMHGVGFKINPLS